MNLLDHLIATVDTDGRLVLPPEVANRLGLRPGISVTLDEEPNSARLRRPVEQLAKVYVEPTSRCNLTCRTCIRNAWAEPLGDMSEETFTRLLEGLAAFDRLPAVFFGGFGEPLAHPGILEMVARVKDLGSPKVELITNGCLLSEETSRSLIEAGLDTLWVSLDGIRPESYSDVRLGALLPQVLENLRGFREVRRRLCDCSSLPEPHELPGWGLVRGLVDQYVSMERYLLDLVRDLKDDSSTVFTTSSTHLQDTRGSRPAPEIGIAFVAMKRNITDLPFLLWIGRLVGASRFNISNVIPYTRELLSEILYEDSLGIAPLPTPWPDALRLPPMDVTETTRRPLWVVIHGRHEATLLGTDVGGITRRCPFIEAGSTSVSWEGNVSPCQALVHTHEELLFRRIRRVDRYAIGHLNERSLTDIWSDPDYVAFRKRVQDFDFALASPAEAAACLTATRRTARTTPSRAAEHVCGATG